MPLRLILLTLSLVLTPPALAITPSDVYREARIVIQQLDATRERIAPDATLRTPGIQIGKTPLHVYTKTLELLEKIQRYNREQGLPITPLPALPTGNVTPREVFELIRQAQAGVETINRRLNIDLRPAQAVHVGMTPSDVYEQVWQASYLMDALVAPLKPADVLRNAHMIEQGLLDLASSMGTTVKLGHLRPEDGSGKRPEDVNIEAYRLLYKLARLQRQQGMQPSLVPGFPSGKVLPEDVYDTTNNILAELIRLNTHLNTGQSIRRQPSITTPVTPSDVYSQVVRINQIAAQLIN